MQLKSIVRKVIPGPIREWRQRYKLESSTQTFFSQWKEAIAETHLVAAERPIQRILVIPPDPGTLMGALGDDAMVTSVTEMAKARNPNVKIHVLTGSPAASGLATEFGLIPVEIWADPNFAAKYSELLKSEHYDAVVAMGADIMDAYHDFLGSSKMIASVDIPARRGIPASVLGFSFNARPNLNLAALYDAVSPKVLFRLRDRISLERFTAFTKANAVLVSDSAFVLNPGEIQPSLTDWIDARRAAGTKVIGINVHPMLFRDASDEQIDAIVARGVEALIKCSEENDVAWLLLPHDYRGRLGDAICLKPIHEQIRERLGERVEYLEGRHRAATLKALAGRLDGVVSARMHLAIATLGMNVPTLCVTYQDKFEGLYDHFKLPSWLLISPEEYIEQNLFSFALSKFISELEELKSVVSSNRDAVIELSKENFKIFD